MGEAGANEVERELGNMADLRVHERLLCWWAAVLARMRGHM